MRRGVLLGHPAEEQDHLSDHQFGDAPGVGVRGVEDRHAALFGGLEVDLVGADAEGADGQELAGLGERRGGQLGARADADEVGVANRLGQRLGAERGVDAANMGVAVVAEDLLGARMHALEQHDLQLFLGERSLLHGVMGFLESASECSARIRTIRDSFDSLDPN